MYDKNIKNRYLIIIYVIPYFGIVKFNWMKYYYLLYYYYIIKLYDLRTCVVKRAINESRRENIIISYKATQRRGDGGSIVPKQRLRTRSFRARFLYAAVCVVFRPPVFEGGGAAYTRHRPPSHRLPEGGGGPGRHARARMRHANKTGSASRLDPPDGGITDDRGWPKPAFGGDSWGVDADAGKWEPRGWR